MKIKRFNEDATATMGNTGGMGAVVAAQPSSTPGDVAGSTPGSGDIGHGIGVYTKSMQKKKKKRYSNDTYDNMYVTKFTDFDSIKNEGVFGWSYPPGAASDPNAPYNQNDDEFIDVMGIVQDTIVERGDMNEIDAENYLEKIDFSDFVEMCEILSNNNPLPWEVIKFDENDNPIYADNEYMSWEKEIRKQKDWKTHQALIKLKKKELLEVWNKQIAEKVYEYLKSNNFPINFSYISEKILSFNEKELNESITKTTILKVKLKKNESIGKTTQILAVNNNTGKVREVKYSVDELNDNFKPFELPKRPKPGESAFSKMLKGYNAGPKERKTLTVEALIEVLKTLPQDYEVKFYEEGSVYNSAVKRAYITAYDKKHGNRDVTLTNK